MLTAAIYARKSTSQAVSDDARSVTRQVERATAYAIGKGWRVDPEHIYVDDGMSGAEFERRPAFLRLLNALKPRAPFHVLVVSEESRLGREQIEVSFVLKQLDQAGVRVWTYLDDRARTLDTPTDRLLLSVAAYADEQERERARQRTHDALERKARAGRVTGGRVFGYDNVEIREADGRRSHVERRINAGEAAVVEQSFRMKAACLGLRKIAAQLNAEAVPAPLPRRAGRSQSWAPSSLLGVYQQLLYKGVVVWNRTQKRDRWGQRKNLPRAENEWVRVEAPELRIVSDELWDAAHARLRAARATYLKATKGATHGRPVATRESRYLLPGLACCSLCLGGLIVRSRASGAGRRFVYGCGYHHARGDAVCRNGLLAPMDATDRAVLTTVEGEVMHPEVVARALDKAVALIAEPPRDREERHRALVARLATLTAEVERFTMTVGAGAGDLLPIVKAMREREEERDRLEAELAALSTAHAVGALDLRRVKHELSATLDDWRGLLTRQTTEAREVLRTLIEGRMRFTPDHDAYVFEGRVALGRLIGGRVGAEIAFKSGGGPNGIREGADAPGLTQRFSSCHSFCF